jgi:adenylate cyclase
MRNVGAAAELSERERQVAERYVEGQSYKEIARALGISPATVRTHANAVYRKLQVTSRIGLLHRLGAAGSVELGASDATRPADGHARAAPSSLSDRPSIAVLPFTNMSGDPEQEYFSDRITEDLITDLSKISGLFVVARNTTFAFKGTPADVRDLSARLGARHLLEGSVRKAGQRVRITAQLIDGGTGGHLWAERYDGDLTDIFALQDEIAAKIVGALRINLLPAERQALASSSTHSVEAYELYLRGRHLLRTDGTRRAEEKARGLFVAATELDGNFAEAIAGIADCDSFLHAYHGKEVSSAEMLASCAKALALNPALADAYASRGQAHALAGDFEQAEHDFMKATELDPELFQAHLFHARLCYLTGRLGEAAQRYLRAAEVRPDDFHCLGLAAACHRDLGDLERMRSDARLQLERARAELERRPHNATAAFHCALAHAMLGEREAALALASRALALDPDDLIVQYNVACARSLLGDLDGAIDLLELVLPRASFDRKEWLRRDSDLAPLYREPRFVALLRKHRVELPGRSGLHGERSPVRA